MYDNITAGQYTDKRKLLEHGEYSKWSDVASIFREERSATSELEIMNVGSYEIKYFPLSCSLLHGSQVKASHLQAEFYCGRDSVKSGIEPEPFLSDNWISAQQRLFVWFLTC